MKTKNQKVIKLKEMLKTNNGKTFSRYYKDNLIQYKIENDNLHCYSEVFFQWQKDNLETWAPEHIEKLIRELGGKNDGMRI